MLPGHVHGACAHSLLIHPASSHMPARMSLRWYFLAAEDLSTAFVRLSVGFCDVHHIYAEGSKPEVRSAQIVLQHHWI